MILFGRSSRLQVAGSVKQDSNSNLIVKHQKE